MRFKTWFSRCIRAMAGLIFAATLAMASAVYVPVNMQIGTIYLPGPLGYQISPNVWVDPPNVFFFTTTCHPVDEGKGGESCYQELYPDYPVAIVGPGSVVGPDTAFDGQNPLFWFSHWYYIGYFDVFAGSDSGGPLDPGPGASQTTFKDAYLGFQFFSTDPSGEYFEHFGYARLSVSRPWDPYGIASDILANVWVDYFIYENVPNRPIRVGGNTGTPEPATASLCCAGAMGLALAAALRRRA